LIVALFNSEGVVKTAHVSKKRLQIRITSAADIRSNFSPSAWPLMGWSAPLVIGLFRRAILIGPKCADTLLERGPVTRLNRADMTRPLAHA
jgi:hypothetical protein